MWVGCQLEREADKVRTELLFLIAVMLNSTDISLTTQMKNRKNIKTIIELKVRLSHKNKFLGNSSDRFHFTMLPWGITLIYKSIIDNLRCWEQDNVKTFHGFQYLVGTILWRERWYDTGTVFHYRRPKCQTFSFLAFVVSHMYAFDKFLTYLMKVLNHKLLKQGIEAAGIRSRNIQFVGHQDRLWQEPSWWTSSGLWA